MGLTKEVREFFTNKINAVLNTRREVIEERIDENLVKQEATKRFLEKFGGVTELARWRKNVQQSAELSKERSKLKNILEKILDEAGCYRPYINDDKENPFESKAKDLFEKKVKADLYPAEMEQIRHLDKIANDVQGAVLLATTEPKLVLTLNKLLNNYGGEITELLDILPKE